MIETTITLLPAVDVATGALSPESAVEAPPCPDYRTMGAFGLIYITEAARIDPDTPPKQLPLPILMRQPS